MDNKSKAERRINMSKIRSNKTRPEMFIRSALHKKGLRFRVNCHDVEGRPDVYFPKRRVAIFVNGCFWHQHNGCKYAAIPKSNKEYWLPKLDKNKMRDKENIWKLIDNKIRVLIIWECTIKKMIKDMDFCKCKIDFIKDFILNSNQKIVEI